MLLEEMKKQMFSALKGGRSVEKEVLRVAMSEAQMAIVKGAPETDETTLAVVRKLIKSNEETLALTTDETQKSALQEEQRVLKAFLPASLTVADIVAALEPVREQLRGAPSDGAATGIAMKHLKASGAVAGGKDVGDAVKQVRA